VNAQDAMVARATESPCLLVDFAKAGRLQTARAAFLAQKLVDEGRVVRWRVVTRKRVAGSERRTVVGYVERVGPGVRPQAGLKYWYAAPSWSSERVVEWYESVVLVDKYLTHTQTALLSDL
jgi:hypothetical protein